MVAVRVCDSVALSLSLTSLTSTGLGVVACCVPGGQGVGAKLLEAGARVADARDSFSKTASEGLTRVQKALPFLAAASAASVAQGNGSNGSDYIALALLVPDSADIRVPQEDARAKQAREDAIGQAEEVKELAQAGRGGGLAGPRRQTASFRHDCGAVPAGDAPAQAPETLAHMTGAQNPVCAQAWTLVVFAALRRRRRITRRVWRSSSGPMTAACRRRRDRRCASAFTPMLRRKWRVDRSGG